MKASVRQMLIEKSRQEYQQKQEAKRKEEERLKAEIELKKNRSGNHASK